MLPSTRSAAWAFGGAAFALSTAALGLFLVVAAPACSSDDAATDADVDASTGVATPDTCDPIHPAKAANGAPCFPVNPTRCFVICPGDTTGGCVCKQDPNDPDAGIWACKPADTSCLPDAAPIDEFDSSTPPPVDSGSGEDDDAGLDAGADADADAG